LEIIIIVGKQFLTARNMMNSKIAVVTGGTRGIGLGIAAALIKRKFSVAITYRSHDDSAEKAKQQLENLTRDDQQILVLKGNVGDSSVAENHHQTIVDQLGNVSILVNNAGNIIMKPFEELTIAEWNDTIQVNLSSAFYWSSLVVPEMKNAGFGRITNISSVAARGGGVVGPHYAASKAGMLGLTRYAARELGGFGITVNAIAPAFISNAGPFTSWTEAQKAELKKKVVVPRLGLVVDVVKAFEYLLDSPYVTGVTLDVNGGLFMI
jgi:3-oxoacyl-[acyl-carrier protein] reductase